MAVYSVHEPPFDRQDSAPDPERFVFVRDGFSWWAFLFGPLWMLRHRMWLVLLGYAIVAAALEAALHDVGASASARVTVGILFGLLIGFEAPTLRRFTLARRKWSNAGIIVGDDLESAEQRFFDGWTKSGGAAVRVPPAGAIAHPPHLQGEPDVIGLFPDPGGHR